MVPTLILIVTLTLFGTHQAQMHMELVATSASPSEEDAGAMQLCDWKDVAVLLSCNCTIEFTTEMSAPEIESSPKGHAHAFISMFLNTDSASMFIK